jgi:hypothetical protein
MRVIVCVLVFFLLSTVGFAIQVTAYWSLTYNGNCSNTVGPVTGTPIIRANPTPVPTISYTSKGAGSNTWNSTNFDETCYYQYKLTANANMTLNYCQLKMETNCSYLHSRIRYSLDNFATYSTMLANYDFSGSNPYTYVNNSLSIPMTAGQTITVRVYGWGALYASRIFYNQTFYLCGHTDETLPVELSSFTASLSYDGNIYLNWTTQSETNVLGYSVFRNTENLISTANCMTQGLIPATNTSFSHSYSYIDDEVGTQHIIYYYWLQYTEFSGETILNSPITIEVNNNGTPAVIPDLTSLQTVYPNPFLSTATIKFGLKAADRVSIEIYNIKGQLVNKLFTGIKDAGNFDILWDGCDMNKVRCAAGVYYIMMNTSSTHTIRKILKF